MNNIIEVEDFYKIIPLKLFRKTEGVRFDIVPNSLIKNVDSLDRVLHTGPAISPNSINGIERPWYMHPYQDDNLIVLHGTRYVDIYSPKHKEKKSFVVTPNEVRDDKGNLIFEGGAMLVWPKGVFHRIRSGETGSASLNLAVHYDGFDITNNFNIYQLNTNTGEYKTAREGFNDQF